MGINGRKGRCRQPGERRGHLQVSCIGPSIALWTLEGTWLHYRVQLAVREVYVARSVHADSTWVSDQFLQQLPQNPMWLINDATSGVGHSHMRALLTLAQIESKCTTRVSGWRSHKQDNYKSVLCNTYLGKSISGTSSTHCATRRAGSAKR